MAQSPSNWPPELQRRFLRSVIAVLFRFGKDRAFGHVLRFRIGVGEAWPLKRASGSESIGKQMINPFAKLGIAQMFFVVVR